MIQSLKKKSKRYYNLIKNFSNWPSFLVFKSIKGKSDVFEFITRDQLKIKVPGKMLPPFKEIFFDEVYFREFPEQLKRKRQITVLDIGANVGFFSLSMFFKFRNATVYAFEPMPFNFQKLEEYQNCYPEFDFQIVNAAVSDHQDEIVLNSSNLDSFSTMSSVFESESRGKKINVPTTRLLDIVAENKISFIDFLKMDCEGSEYSILYSSPDEILEKIGFLSLETHEGKGERENHYALLDFLKEKNFLVKDSKKDNSKIGYIWAWR